MADDLSLRLLRAIADAAPAPVASDVVAREFNVDHAAIVAVITGLVSREVRASANGPHEERTQRSLGH